MSVARQDSATAWVGLLLQMSFLLLFIAASPIYYLNRWDFRRAAKRNPFYTSRLVKLQARFPLLYEVAMVVQNFPSTRLVYAILPPFSGDVLQVGCGTGLLNKCLGRRPDVRLTNLDSNLNALRLGVRLGRFHDYVHAPIDRKTPLADGSFDVVIFARCLHHVKNHRKALTECARLLRSGGRVIILDPVVLADAAPGTPLTGYMANSSIDGVIWRFTRQSFADHLKSCLPQSLSVTHLEFVRQPHVTNYNSFVPQTDALAVLTKINPRESLSCS
jgi:SAM-dependent methyltransferase